MLFYCFSTLSRPPLIIDRISFRFVIVFLRLRSKSIACASRVSNSAILSLVGADFDGGFVSECRILNMKSSIVTRSGMSSVP
ncbi:hypothetical protein PFISCL1PPCAC_1501, partial [Pristionchus fissidentatus]